jgi:1-deoxy-D-xylulose-5-phosphate synthase
VFDTGHQAYVHKILTGRQQSFDRLRQEHGLSGYPSRAESEHDIVENSHASTALSYADGLTTGYALRGQAHRKVVAVVGDGALTGGMCWEALNNIAAKPGPLVIVLNDNGRSYAPTAGAFAKHLAELRLASKEDRKPPNLFETLGLAYLGPVDGHDIEVMEHVLHRATTLDRPVVVHCVTRKGAGYRPAETEETDRMHSVGVIDPRTGQPPTASAPSWTSGPNGRTSWPSPRPCCTRPGYSGSPARFRNGLSTSVSPNSTLSPARQDSHWRACIP